MTRYFGVSRSGKCASTVLRPARAQRMPAAVQGLDISAAPVSTSLQTVTSALAIHGEFSVAAVTHSLPCPTESIIVSTA
jgi:hypothetical protein